MAFSPEPQHASIALATLAFVATTAQADTAIEAYYRADVLYNSSGGIDTGTAYLDDAGLIFDVDLEDRIGVSDATLSVYLLWNNNNRFSEKFVGDLQSISNFDAGRALRAYEFWYEQPLADVLSLRFGLYDLNTEFDAIDTASFFINGSHGIGPDYSQSGETGPSVFPLTALTARFDWRISAASTLRYAILDGVPGDPDDPSKTAIKLGDGDGVLHALEFNHVLTGGMRFGIGTWLYSEEFDLIEGTDISGQPLQDGGNSGFYGFIDTKLLSVEADGFDLTAFIRYGIANDDINVLDSYVGGGLLATGLIRSRGDDQLGLAFASARVGDPYKRAAAAAGSPADSHETNIELTYSAQINDWLRLQPTIQYVINPGVDRALNETLVFGIRFELSTFNR